MITRKRYEGLCAPHDKVDGENDTCTGRPSCESVPYVEQLKGTGYEARSFHTHCCSSPANAVKPGRRLRGSAPGR